jgi:glycosyltransferase involved in cell wall biosynthesis
MRSAHKLNSLSNLIRQISPDVVHSQVNFSLAQQFIASKHALKAAFCVTERNCYPLHGLARARRIVQFYALRLLGVHYSANSRAVAKHLSEMVIAHANKIPILPNGVSRILPDMAVRTRLRAQLGLKPDDIVIGYIARMAAHKGQRDFLKAIHMLREKSVRVKCCLVGNGPERLNLENLARKLGLERDVVFTGIVPNVEDYLQTFDIVALFSTREGMPNAVLEAMAAGRAIVASSVGAIPELLDTGKAGVLLDQPTIPDMANALRSVIQNPSYREALGQAAAKRAHDKFSLESAYIELLGHYVDITN